MTGPPLDMIVSSTKFTLSLFGVGGMWVAQTATDSINWFERYGLTGAIIAALITVIKMQYSAGLQAQKDALAAKDALILAAKDSAAIHQATSTELIRATYHQTDELVKFNERLLAIDANVRKCPVAALHADPPHVP